MTTDNAVRIIQLSDLHLFADPQQILMGVNTQESFNAIVAMLKKEKFSFAILSGDLGQDGSEKAYLRIAKALKFFQVPIYYVPGNHDDSRVLAAVYPVENISNQRHIILKNWQIILLNSVIPEAVDGYLDDAQLTYLKNCLQDYPEHRALIFFHHSPILLNTAWLDKYCIKNAAKFWDLVNNHANVTGVFYGHVHMEAVEKVEGVYCYSAPATCFQFKRYAEQFALENIAPGYRIIELSVAGRLTTLVKRLSYYVGEFIENTSGY